MEGIFEEIDAKMENHEPTGSVDCGDSGLTIELLESALRILANTGKVSIVNCRSVSPLALGAQLIKLSRDAGCT